jgi:hypothetical protein
LFNWESSISTVISINHGSVQIKNNSMADKTSVESSERTGHNNSLPPSCNCDKHKGWARSSCPAHGVPCTGWWREPPVIPPLAIQEVLEGMADVFEPLPQGLPPSREFDLRVHLEPGSKTANQCAYPKPLRLRDECRVQISDLW